MKVLIFFLVSSLLCLPPSHRASPTIRCFIEPKSVKGALKQSTAVFSGEVLEIRSGVNFLQARFRVEHSWKGVQTDEVLVSTDGSAESPHYKVGEGYLVFAGIRNDKLFTGSCSRTKRLEDAEGDLQQLGEAPARKSERALEAQAGSSFKTSLDQLEQELKGSVAVDFRQGYARRTYVTFEAKPIRFANRCSITKRGRF